jgi:3-oxoacyl-[acyl-carrier protein] reductase
LDKMILITGTSRGIGRYLAEYYLDKGPTVVGCSRAETDLKHDRYEHFSLDVSDEKAVSLLVSDVRRKYKRIDYLINNAGIASANAALLTPLSAVEKIYRTNVFGTFLFCREVGKLMMRKKFGRIVNFTTGAVPLDLEGESIYASSKAAVESLTRILAREFAGSGITCNAVGPALVQTDMTTSVSSEKIQELLDRQPIAEFAGFEDVANVIDFFVSDRSAKITGQQVYLCGVS